MSVRGKRSGSAVLLALALGVAVGLTVHLTLSPADAHSAADLLSLVTQGFLRLIQMTIAPLVFSTLTTAVAKAGQPGEVGRIGLRAFAWFLGAAIIALLIGATMALWLRPGAGLHLVASEAAPAVQALSPSVFVQHLIPTSIFDAMARNEILQVVIFSLITGTAMAALGERVSGAVQLVEQLAAIMFKIVDMVMRLAPAAVFCALAAVIAVQGAGVIGGYAAFLLDFYLALAVVWTAILAAGWMVGGRSPLSVLSAVRQPLLIAFSTTSSEAAYPRTLEVLAAAGVRERVSSFVLPLGYAFNLDGAMVYAAFAVLFIAQAYGVALSPGQIGLMLLLLLVSSKGVAAVPRAVLVVVATTLPVFHIPAAGLALLLGVDQMLDMGRSATNVLGNFVAACVVDKYEPR
ncbi:MAG: dicarboxylate/amino acid:cation symporter [Caulobacteraceae bacterium]